MLDLLESLPLRNLLLDVYREILNIETLLILVFNLPAVEGICWDLRYFSKVEIGNRIWRLGPTLLL